METITRKEDNPTYRSSSNVFHGSICGRIFQVRVAEQAQKKMQKLMQQEAEAQDDLLGQFLEKISEKKKQLKWEP